MKQVETLSCCYRVDWVQIFHHYFHSLLTFASFAMGNRSFGVAIESFFTVIAKSSSSVVSTIPANSATFSAWQLEEFHVESTSSRVIVALTRCNKGQSKEKTSGTNEKMDEIKIDHVFMLSHYCCTLFAGWHHKRTMSSEGMPFFHLASSCFSASSLIPSRVLCLSRCGWKEKHVTRRQENDSNFLQVYRRSFLHPQWVFGYNEKSLQHEGEKRARNKVMLPVSVVHLRRRGG